MDSFIYILFPVLFNEYYIHNSADAFSNTLLCPYVYYTLYNEHTTGLILDSHISLR